MAKQCAWCRGFEEVDYVAYDKDFCRMCNYYIGRIISSLTSNCGAAIPFNGGRFSFDNWMELKKFLIDNAIKTVIEYGSGMSTEFLMMEPYLTRIVSLESDAAWYAVCKAAWTFMKSKQVELVKVEQGKTIEYPIEPFDFALVDGPSGDRGYSVEHAVKCANLMYLHDPNTGDQIDVLKREEAAGRWEPITTLSREDTWRFWRRR